MDWLERQRQKMLLSMAVSTFERIRYLSGQLHHAEIIRAAQIADELLPKLRKEQAELKGRKK